MYHAAFDISERIPDVLILLPAIIGLGSLAVLSLRTAWRPWLRRHSWVWLGLAGLLWATLEIHNVGGTYGFYFSIPALAMLTGAGLLGLPKLLPAKRDNGSADGLRYPFSHDAHRRNGLAGLSSLALVISGIGLILAAVGAQAQLPALDLQHQMADGRAAVLTGVVEHSMNHTWGYECFSVAGKQFCYDDGPTSVGFHQSGNNGGPIHDGLQVRVTYIGDVIVRLEIADVTP